MNPHQRFKQIAVAVGLLGALAAVTALGVAPPSSADLPATTTIIDPLQLAAQPAEQIEQFIQTETIRRGDTLGQLLGRIGASDPQFLRFVADDATARKALQMRAGRTVQAEIDSAGQVRRFSYRLGGLEDDRDADILRPLTRVQVLRDGESLVATEEKIPLERVTEIRSAVIQSSLFAATDAAGIPEAVAVKVANVFGGDVDFHRDLRRGDRLRVVYETVREAGSFDAPAASRVLAIEFVNAGKRLNAVWFERDGRGEYFTFDGRSMKRAFLRNPIEFSRITSGFSTARQHPIFRDWRAHRGVDFAAPSGTRVHATADGTVEFAGRRGGYGNVVILRHHGQYSTVYAHLQAIAPGIHAGARVSQGDTVGGVGQTGWATGPHLHYEVKVANDHIDPLTIPTTQARSLESADQPRFALTRDVMRERFVQADTLRVARFQ